MPIERLPATTIPAPASPYGSVDAHGRALPLTEAEVRTRNLAAIRGLQALDAMGDEDEQRETLDALLQALKETPL